MSAEVPLARLFAMGSYALVSQLHERLEARGFTEVRPAFAFVLLASREQPLTGNDVARLMAMTKQAASKLVDAMEAAHYLVRKPHPDDARAKLLHIGAKGKRLLEAAEQIYADIEAEWAKVIGTQRLNTIRRDLITVLEATNGGTLPPIRPSH